MNKDDTKNAILFIAGHKDRISLNCCKENAQAHIDVLIASRALYEALNDDNVTLAEIKKLVETKKHYARVYSDITEKNWLL